MAFRFAKQQYIMLLPDGLWVLHTNTLPSRLLYRWLQKSRWRTLHPLTHAPLPLDSH